jgi:hypothetical protein
MSEAEIRAAIEAKLRTQNEHIDVLRRELQPLAVDVICTAIMQCIDANAQRMWGANLAEVSSRVGVIHCTTNAVSTHRGIFADFPKHEKVDWARYDDSEPMSLAVALSFLYAEKALDVNRAATTRHGVVANIKAALCAEPYSALCVLSSSSGIFIDYKTPNYYAIEEEVRERMRTDARERCARAAAATAALRAHRPGARTKAALRTPKSAAATH